MTLSELIKQAQREGNHFNTYDIPMKKNGRDFSIILSAEHDDVNGWFIDVKDDVVENYEEFVNKVYEKIKEYPSCWRKGQSVFNAVEELYGSEVAREVQYVNGVDCFYKDDMIDPFLMQSWVRYKEIH